MLHKLFPWILQLHILQLEEYNLKRYFKWLTKHFWTRNLEQKKKLIWTNKAAFIFRGSVFYFILASASLCYYLQLTGAVISLSLSLIYSPFLILATITLKPYEFFNRIKIKRQMKTKILSLKAKGLKVIGITGSYGKTTTKEFLSQILASKYKVLKSPNSYNTLFGLYHVVDLELDEKYDFFICEMGAYKTGEIGELCDCLLPDHGILTGINEQHLERFGKIENTITTKFELIDAIPETGIKVLNIDNDFIARNYIFHTQNAILYGKTSKQNSIDNIRYQNGKTSFTLTLDGNSYEINNINVFGLGNILNVLASATMANKLGVSVENIRDVLKQIKSPKHRLEIIHQQNGTIIIDDAYSSNISGFNIALDFLETFTARPKILVTPGIVELGKSTTNIHKELGKKVDLICTHVILIGRSERTEAIASVVDTKKIYFISSIYQLNGLLKQLCLNKSVVLIENDLPDQYY